MFLWTPHYSGKHREQNVVKVWMATTRHVSFINIIKCIKHTTSLNWQLLLTTFIYKQTLQKENIKVNIYLQTNITERKFKTQVHEAILLKWSHQPWHNVYFHVSSSHKLFIRGVVGPIPAVNPIFHQMFWQSKCRHVGDRMQPVCSFINFYR